MKISMPEIANLDSDLLPESEFDEFGERVIRPSVSHVKFVDGSKHIYLNNHAQYSAYIKRLSRNRDARRLERGEISKAELIRKNDMFSNVDFSKIRIVAIGDRRYEDID